MKSKIFLFIPAIISLFLFNSHTLNSGRNQVDLNLNRLTISAAGDLMCHSPQFEYARNDKGGFDFNINFYYVKNIIERSDLAVANFETTLAGKGKKYSGYPAFNTPDEFLIAVKNAGFDFLFTSNNHSYDRGKEGILKTLAKIKQEGLAGTGSFISKRDMDSVKIVKVKGFNIGFLSYTEHLNGFKLPKGNEFLVNLIDSNKIRTDIQKLKRSNADLVIVYFHFGDEYKRQPTAYQRVIVKKAISYGSDIILASHPHVIEKLETFKPVNSKLDTGFVAYSLGNFISNQRWRYSDAGVILNFTIERESQGSLTLENISIVPTWVYKGRIFIKNAFAVIPSSEAFSANPLPFLSSSDVKKMKESYSDAMEIMLKNLVLSKSKITPKDFFRN